MADKEEKRPHSAQAKLVLVAPLLADNVLILTREAIDIFVNC
jgi:hypothetical protein